MKNLVLKFELTLNFLKSIYTGSNIYMYPTNIWFNVLLRLNLTLLVAINNFLAKVWLYI